MLSSAQLWKRIVSMSRILRVTPLKQVLVNFLTCINQKSLICRPKSEPAFHINHKEEAATVEIL